MNLNNNLSKVIAVYEKMMYLCSLLFNRKYAVDFPGKINKGISVFEKNALNKSADDYKKETNFERKSILHNGCNVKDKKTSKECDETIVTTVGISNGNNENPKYINTKIKYVLNYIYLIINKFIVSIQNISNFSPIRIFFLALSIRLLFYFIVIVFNIKTLPTVEEAEYLVIYDSNCIETPLVDCTEYYNNSLNLSVTPFFGQYYGYYYWYERNPLHILFLWLTHQSLLIQILLSALSVALLFKMNKYAGLIYLLYPQHILYSVLYLRLTLLIFLVILSMFLLRSKSEYWLIPIIIFLQIAFGSTMQLHPSTPGIMREYKFKLMDNIWHFWKPSFNYISSVTKNNLFIYIQSIPYIALMILFIKKIKFSSAIFVLCVIFSIGFGLMFAHEYHREILMPLIVFYTLSIKEKREVNLIKSEKYLNFYSPLYKRNNLVA